MAWLGRSKHPGLAKEDISWWYYSLSSANVFRFLVSVVTGKVSSHDHISSNKRVLPETVSCWNFWLPQRENWLGSSLPNKIKGFIYRTSNQNDCFSHHFAIRSGRDLPDLHPPELCFFKNQACHFKLRFDEFQKEWSCGRKTSRTNSTWVQDSFQESLQLLGLWRLSATAGCAKLENGDVGFYWPPSKLSTPRATVF